MLVITRRKNTEFEIYFGEQTVKVKILEIQDGVTKVGIAAPPEVRIARTELVKKLKNEDKTFT